MYNSDQGVYDPSSLAFLLQWLLAQTVEQSLEIQKQSQQGGDQVLMTEVKTIISSLIKEIKGKLREPTIIRPSKRSKIQKHLQQNRNHANKALKITNVKTQFMIKEIKGKEDLCTIMRSKGSDWQTL